MSFPGPARDPGPPARHGEIALIAVMLTVLACGGAAVAGVAVMTALSARTWIWPADVATGAQVVTGLLTGHLHQGWTPRQVAALPGPPLIYAGAVVGQVVAAAVAAGAAIGIARYRVPTDARRGLARRSEVAAVLGAGHLRAVAPLIRPDLHGPHAEKGPHS